MANGQYNSFPIDWKSLDASQVPYTNTASGLSATDVQGAIDELKTDLDDVVSGVVNPDQYVLTMLDGTLATYKKLMRYWFMANGANTVTSYGLTALCDRWYDLVRPVWDGGTRFAEPTVAGTSTGPDGTKVGDNDGMAFAPSSETVHGASDYEGNPLFIPTDVNVVLDPTTREPIITAIDGVTDGFERYNPSKFVGVMQMSGYVAQTQESDAYTVWYSSVPSQHEGAEPLAQAVRWSDNTVRPWVVHAKYLSQTIDGKLTSFSGALPTSYSISHNTLQTLSAATGTGYSGMCYCDQAFLYLMNVILTGSLTADGTMMQGCLNANWQVPVAVAETGVKRVLVTTANGSYFKVGMQVLIGNYAGNKDRGQTAMFSITGNTGAKITAIGTVTVEGTDYTAITVDVDEEFDAVANGADVNGTTYLSSFGWATGINDSILGFSGNAAGNTTGIYPSTIQGIEYSAGKYEVIGDTILNLYKDTNDVYWYEPYTVKDRTKQATSVTANYTATGLKLEQPSTASWQYIKKLSYAMGMFFATLVGGSSSTYTLDAIYENAATTGTRESLLFGALHIGVGGGGLSYVGGGGDLSGASWAIASRLSFNGSRGESVA